ncbi:MAG: FAD-dependent oxidoreductase [Anaerolineae bacterium]|nr:FAD-dependent oxidoreductase [Anaerolineae bacterium]
MNRKELVVIGAGPAGIEAALTASELGVEVLLVDSFPTAGGQYYKQPPQAFEDHRKKNASQKEGKLLLQMLDSSNVQLLTGCLVWGLFEDHDKGSWVVQLALPDRPMQVKADAVIIATGAYDRPFAFPGWTLPGVMTAGAGQILVKTQGVVPGSKVLLTGTGPLQIALADQLIHAGVTPVAMLEASTISLWDLLRHVPVFLGQFNRMVEGLGYGFDILRSGMQVRMGWAVVEARGDGSVEEAVIARLGPDWKVIAGSEEKVQVDTVILGYGLVPNNRLSRMVECEHEYVAVKGGWVPIRDETLQTTCPNVYVVGDAAGVGGAELAHVEGKIAGLAVASRCGRGKQSDFQWRYAKLRPELLRQRRYAKALGELFTPQPGALSLFRENMTVCRCEEVSYRDILDAIQLGARSVNEVKMITRAGMGNCQGRMCEGLIAQILLNALSVENVDMQRIGASTVRPPLEPMTLDMLARASQMIETEENQLT